MRNHLISSIFVSVWRSEGVETHAKRPIPNLSVSLVGARSEEWLYPYRWDGGGSVLVVILAQTKFT